MPRLKELLLDLTPPCVAERFRQWWPAAHDRYRAECARVMRLPPHTVATMRIANRNMTILDGRTAASSVTRMFGPPQKGYFRSPHLRPRIVDCGANVGLTVLYWKTLFPHSRVLAFEPDPDVYPVLERNCFGLTDVTLVNAAAWVSDGMLEWTANGNDGGFLSSAARAVSDERPKVAVRAVRLRPFLDEPVDLLKMDIEGAEVEVMHDIADALGTVDRLMIEYHSFTDQDQRLNELLNCLRRAGFRVHIENPDHAYGRPLDRCLAWNGKDLHLELYARRLPVGT